MGIVTNMLNIEKHKYKCLLIQTQLDLDVFVLKQCMNREKNVFLVVS